jgi:hypothetical protein
MCGFAAPAVVILWLFWKEAKFSHRCSGSGQEVFEDETSRATAIVNEAWKLTKQAQIHTCPRKNSETKSPHMSLL